MGTSRTKDWLLLIHQIPPKPAYLRVKIWRRLQQVGAVAVKQSVYVLPKSDQAHEDFRWILREIVEGGGEGSICEAGFLEGLSDNDVVATFQSARRAEYEKILQEAQSVQEEIKAMGSESIEGIQKNKSRLSKLQKRLQDTVAVDFFPTPERSTAEFLISGILDRLKGERASSVKMKESLESLKGKTWVTRADVYIDRIASGWLIRRFIEKGAKFKFVDAMKYAPKKHEIRFDMFEAEFTHEGGLCTFEVMVERLGLGEKALSHIAEIVHDMDFRDEKFGRPEVPGLRALMTGIAESQYSDQEKLDKGAVILDELYAHLSRGKKR